MYEHGVRVAPEKREALQQHLKGVGHRAGISLFLQHAHLGIFVQDLRSVRGRTDIGGEVLACGVTLHVEPSLPQPAFA